MPPPPPGGPARRGSGNADRSAQPTHEPRQPSHPHTLSSPQTTTPYQLIFQTPPPLPRSQHTSMPKTPHLEVLSNLADQSLERQLADQQLGTLLVLTDLTAHHPHPGQFSQSMSPPTPRPHQLPPSSPQLPDVITGVSRGRKETALTEERRFRACSDVASSLLRWWGRTSSQPASTHTKLPNRHKQHASPSMQHALPHITLHVTKQTPHTYPRGCMPPSIHQNLTFVASCFLGAFPPVDLRAVCLVRAIVTLQPIQYTTRASAKPKPSITPNVTAETPYNQTLPRRNILNKHKHRPDSSNHLKPP